VLVADGHVAKITDEGGYSATETDATATGEADGWLGAYKANPTGSLIGGSYTINKGGYDEIRETMWCRQIGNAGGGAGGGAFE